MKHQNNILNTVTTIIDEGESKEFKEVKKGLANIDVIVSIDKKEITGRITLTINEKIDMNYKNISNTIVSKTEKQYPNLRAVIYFRYLNVDDLKKRKKIK
ncbi:hypothetical protein [Paenibacillus sp. N3.4]|uniref:hypothetical protein n=1 Tax=Paenibacillus sp. N3.4 TaxID=2603222 RepID=UPI001650D3BA|nr:hypothetical protein [Paenibacillus sp. N3.4]